MQILLKMRIWTWLQRGQPNLGMCVWVCECDVKPFEESVDLKGTNKCKSSYHLQWGNLNVRQSGHIFMFIVLALTLLRAVISNLSQVSLAELC